jgi:hypothetical protein
VMRGRLAARSRCYASDATKTGSPLPRTRYHPV